MVYCGKPSKGCQICRERKVRCDQVPEGCGQCEKQNVVCPGYRDQLDLLFRNESQNVIRKAKTREVKTKQGSSSKPKGLTPPPPISTAIPATSGPTTLEEEMSTIIRQDSLFPTFIIPSAAFTDNIPSLSHNKLRPTLEECAIAYFISNYVIGCKAPTQGFLDALETTHDFDDILMASIRACGLAGFANVESSTALMKEARKEYATALRLTNQALMSPKTAKRDSTLLSIMILGIYETISGTNQKSLKSWAEHIRGATTLVKLRGLEQLETPEGRRMFIQVISNLLISCIQRDMPLPDHILELREEMKKKVDTKNPAWQFHDLMILFCAFQANSKDVSTPDPRWILATALEIDGRLMALFVDPPLSWRYETRYTDLNSESVWKGCYHVYHDYLVAQIWNAMRACRMMLNESICQTLLQGFSTKPPVFSAIEHSTQFHLSTDIIFQMQTDILSSVPQHMGTFPKYMPTSNPGSTAQSATALSEFSYLAGVSPMLKLATKTPANSQSNSIFDKDFPVLRASSGYFLMWPLYLTGVIEVASEESRQWVTGRLKSIGRTMGIRQAYFLAEVVEKRTPIRDWTAQQDTVSNTRQQPYMETPDIELDDVEHK